MGALPLELCAERRIVHTSMSESGEYFFGIPAVNRQHVIHFAVIGESEQCLLGHRVDGVRGGEGLDVKDVRSLGVFRSGAGQQEALRLRPGSGKFLPPGRGKQIPVGFVGPFGDGNTETVLKLLRDLSHNRLVPAADEERCHGADFRAEAGFDPPLDPSHVRNGSGDVLLPREQERDIDRHACEDRLLNRRESLARARNLDEEVRPVRSRVKLGGLFDTPGSIVCEKR